MVRLIAIVSVTSLATTGLAEEVLREIAWDSADQAGQLPKSTAGQVAVEDGVLAVESAGPEGASIGVLALDEPGVTSTKYAIVGQVRYEGVEGDGYLEMWSCFEGKGQFYSRTLGNAGPMAKLTGSSDWRRFVLPYHSKADAPPPDKLIVNVVLPGAGKVWLGPIELVQYEAGADPLAAPGQWWSDSASGWLGAICGTVFGCMGGLIGWLSSRGRGRNVTFAMLRIMQVVGIVCLVGGVAALIASQPYGVYYPLLLLGVLLPVLGICVSGTVRKRYDQVELRKMSALDAV